MGIFNNLQKTISNINPSNFKFVDKKEWSNVTANYQGILKSWDPNMIDTNSRASLPQPYVDTPSGSKIPLWRLQPQRMYDMATDVGDLRAIFETIQREMFRNGVKVQPKYKYKCMECLKTFASKPLNGYVPLGQLGRTQAKEDKLICDECGNDDSKRFRKPDPKGRVILQTFMDDPVNNNGQMLKTLARQYERDLDVVDYAIVSVSRNYVFKPVNDVTGATIEVDMENSDFMEAVRVHPMEATFIANDEAILGLGSDNEPRWICPNYTHRDKFLQNPYCDKCGAKAFTAIMEINAVPYGLPIANPNKMYYAKHELIWTPGKYMPDLLYGNSPLNAVWKKVMSLHHQDEYLWKYFDKDRPPKSILAIGSRNYETVQSFYDRQRQGARADPYMPRPILLNTDNVNASLQFIDLTPNFKELELSSVRVELRQIISSIYGVQPVFYGEQTKAGLGNESLQVTITNRTIKFYQKFLNENFFQKFSKMLGVDDWEFVLIDSEEIDKLREEQIRNQEIQNATLMYQMGFDVYTDGNKEFVFSQFPNPERQELMLKSGKQSVEDGKPAGDKKTNFDGEPQMTKPQDTPGAGGKSAGAGSGLGKAFGDVRETAIEIFKKGMTNEWTWSHMAKELSKSTSIEQTEALKIIKFLVQDNIG